MNSMNRITTAIKICYKITWIHHREW